MNPKIRAYCSGCQIELMNLSVTLEGEKKEVWSHPVPAHGDCMYQNDGIKVETEVTDPFMMQKFQESVVHLADELPEEDKKHTENSAEKIALKEDFQLSPLKERLLCGNLTLWEYKAIVEVLNG